MKTETMVLISISILVIVFIAGCVQPPVPTPSPSPSPQISPTPTISPTISPSPTPLPANYIPANSTYVCGDYGNDSATIMLRAPAIFLIQAKFKSNCVNYAAYWTKTTTPNTILEVDFRPIEPRDRACMKCIGMDHVTATLDLSWMSSLVNLEKIVVKREGKIIAEKSFQGAFCGGIAAFQCPTGYYCALAGSYPDAGGSCHLNATGMHCGGFIQNAPTCPEDYYCKLTINAPDTGGSCMPNLGTLEGNVTVGPICPVERPGVPCPVPPEAYTSRKLVATGPLSSQFKTIIDIDSTGHYFINLAPGNYTISLLNTSMGRGTNLPANVTINNLETTTLDVDIDTGIR